MAYISLAITLVVLVLVIRFIRKENKADRELNDKFEKIKKSSRRKIWG